MDMNTKKIEAYAYVDKVISLSHRLEIDNLKLSIMRTYGFGDIFLDRYLKKLYSCGKIDMTLNKRELINLNFKDENLSQKEKTEEEKIAEVFDKITPAD